MELFRQINNEALDEDKRIQRQVIERLKKQVELFNQPFKKPVELSDITLNNIQRYIINFDDTLNKSLNDVYKKGDDKEDTGDLILNYNLLANYLDKINFNLANVNDKRDIFELLDELMPKISKVLSVIKLKHYTDADLVEKLYNNFKNHTYNVILEKERNITEKEAEKKVLEEEMKEGEEKGKSELQQLSPKEQNIKRLEDILEKSRKIADKEKLIKSSYIYKAFNQGETLLNQIRSGVEPLAVIKKFFRDYEEKINKKYEAIFNPKVAEKIAEAQAEEKEPEETKQTFTMAPVLQQGAEEPRLPELEIQNPVVEEASSMPVLEKKKKKQLSRVEKMTPEEYTKKTIENADKKNQARMRKLMRLAEEQQPQEEEGIAPLEDLFTGEGKPKKEVWKIHAILINDKIPFTEAEKTAQHILKKKGKIFFRHEGTHYRFRGVPKTKCKVFRSHKVNDNITIVFCLLK